MARLLIAEDDPEIAMLERDYLEVEGYDVTVVDNGQQAVTEALNGDYSLLLLDLMLPGCSGYDVCRLIRDRIDVPILMVTARTESVDKIRGLGLGADDYIAKPFEPLELLARIEVVLRRRGRGQALLTYGPIRQDLDSHTVTLRGEAVPLSPKEFELLRVFLQNQNLALGREKLLAMVWGYEFAGESRTVDIHVQRLRQKLELADRLVTLPRIGYRLEKLP